MYLANRTVKYEDDSHPILIGVGGDWENDSQNQIISNYPLFLKTFQDNFSPSIWNLVYFPYISPASGLSSSQWLERFITFYRDLQYFAYISRFTANPLWVTCRCQAFNNYYGYKAILPTLRYLRSVVFTALAYGAQGIYYWNYRQNIDHSGITFTAAPITREGAKTSLWDVVKTVNEEVMAFNDVFFGCEVLDCRHISKILSGLKMMKHAMGPLMSIDGTSLELIVSHIFNLNTATNYLIIVASPHSSTSQVLTLRFSDYWKISKLIKSGDGFRISTLSSYTQTETLNLGDYLIYTWI